MEKRGILLLNDPLRRTSRFSQLHQDTKVLAFREGERFLSQAQAALYSMRKEYGWICVAASGCAVGIALALAAQLMVDRLALWMEPVPPKRPRELLRIDGYAKRNLSLIACEILLVEPPEDGLRALMRGIGRGCVLRCADAAALTDEELVGDWNRAVLLARH